MRDAVEVEETIKSAVSDDALPSEAQLAAMVPQRFEVRDEGAADWLVRKVVEADAHI